MRTSTQRFGAQMQTKLALGRSLLGGLVELVALLRARRRRAG